MSFNDFLRTHLANTDRMRSSNRWPDRPMPAPARKVDDAEQIVKNRAIAAAMKRAASRVNATGLYPTNHAAEAHLHTIMREHALPPFVPRPVSHRVHRAPAKQMYAANSCIIDDVCSICYGQQTGSIKLWVSTTCQPQSHHFHKACLEAWLRFKGRPTGCPLCRQQVTYKTCLTLKRPLQQRHDKKESLTSTTPDPQPTAHGSHSIVKKPLSVAQGSHDGTSGPGESRGALALRRAYDSIQKTMKRIAKNQHDMWTQQMNKEGANAYRIHHMAQQSADTSPRPNSAAPSVRSRVAHVRPPSKRPGRFGMQTSPPLSE